MASGLPDAALENDPQSGDEVLPVPTQAAYVHAGGLMTTWGGQCPCDSGLRSVAFCLPRRHRLPRLHCFRRSIPRLYAPLSTLRAPPHGETRMTRGQCGSLLLHCYGLAPFTSCRTPGAPRLNSSPRTIAVYASPWSLPSTTQHSLPGWCYLYLGRTFTGWIAPASPGAPVLI